MDVNNGGFEEDFVEDNIDNEDLVEDMGMDDVRVQCA